MTRAGGRVPTQEQVEEFNRRVAELGAYADEIGIFVDLFATVRTTPTAAYIAHHLNHYELRVERGVLNYVQRVVRSGKMPAGSN
ncbi:hypothetical protein DEIPH_ctg045orf0002 [Deinococcus phoenicis]|uniref:Uncharacterized protein n=1 Tax=Deinococcus phoenicis TaxID=1476583 RepID=A0A016QNB6_9DEIO|nr:hypothetical protein [Deinococcus phoenicis]EYB67274.1 hypothetical protein DEIPH_ctg045orf0002 [Deinococcus phoenicis]